MHHSCAQGPERNAAVYSEHSILKAMSFFHLTKCATFAVFNMGSILAHSQESGEHSTLCHIRKETVTGQGLQEPSTWEAQSPTVSVTVALTGVPLTD